VLLCYVYIGFVIPYNGSTPCSLLSYNDQLFVGRADGLLAIYDTATLQLIRTVALGGGNFIPAIALSHTGNFLYFSVYSSYNVYAVSLPLTTASTLQSWYAASAHPMGLSFNGANNVLVAWGSGLREYTSVGTLVREIVNEGTAMAVEQLNGALAVSFYSGTVRLMSTSGTVLKSYGGTVASGQAISPRGLAVDKEGFILVCDCDNNRVLVLNPTMSEVRELPTVDVIGTINYPYAIWLDQSKGRLYITEQHSPLRVVVYENMFNIGEAFYSMKPLQ
jgi:DNA-binding beta-propeller fold protein YncE